MTSAVTPVKRRRRLGVCHNAGSILPAPLRLLQDLARPSVPLQRRNAIRKSSAPVKSINQSVQCSVRHDEINEKSAVLKKRGSIHRGSVAVSTGADGKRSTRMTRSRRRTYPLVKRGVRGGGGGVSRRRRTCGNLPVAAGGVCFVFSLFLSVFYRRSMVVKQTS